MFIKALLLFALIMIIISLVKRGKHNSNDTPPSSDRSLDKTMKRCAECGVHLPEHEAVTYQTLHFCCNEHKKLYLEDKNT